MSRLDEICATKRGEVAERKTHSTVRELEERAGLHPPPRPFRAALVDRAETGFALIAEIKKASPSKGLIRSEFDPADHARAYEKGGAACLSVLTDHSYFQGHEDFLVAARAASGLPVLRKDFMIDPWQVTESRAIGADAILIIVAALSRDQMREIADAAVSCGMDVLVEVHDETELERATDLGANLIGINNRDLRSFTTDLSVTQRLAPLAPASAFLISESGIAGRTDCERLADMDVRAFLVGESLMREHDIEAATRALIG